LHHSLAAEVVAGTKRQEFRGFRLPTVPYTFALHSGRPVGAVIALVDVVAVEGTAGDWCWVLGSNVRVLPKAVPCKGKLSLWKPDDTTLRAVLAQLGRPA
jgi:hypothetical protein